MDIRQVKQSEAVASIRENKYTGLIHVSPRVGKSKLMIDALNFIKKPLKVLILVPSVPIIKSWKAEIKKWGLSDLITPVFLWHNSLRKIKDSYDLIVCDEIHEYNDKVLLQLKKHQIAGSRILGLSGTINKQKEACLRSMLNLKKIYEYTFEEAIADGVIADYEIICVGCELNEIDATVTAGTEDKPFKQTEYNAYEYWNNRYNNIAYNNDYKMRKTIISKRKSIIYNSDTKINKTQEIVNSVDRCIVFTGLQEVADQMGQASYHSKSKDNSLEEFSLGHLDKLAVVSMVSMGITIPNLKVAVFNQVKSNEALFIQQVLRTMNLDGDQKATIYIVYLKNTQDAVWVKSATEGFNKSKITFI